MATPIFRYREGFLPNLAALNNTCKLKRPAKATSAELWPNYEMVLCQARRPFPEFYA